MKFLFDLGGVFFDWDPKYFFNKVFNNSKEMDYFLENICNNNWNIKQDAGRSITEAEEILISTYPSYSKEIKMYYSNHRKMIRKIYQESINILDDLKIKNFECYVLSNWSAETFEGMIEDYPFLKKFDGMVISGEAKLVKPNPKIYQLAIKKFNLIPNETIFVDDKLENIITAETMKFKTIHLKDPSIIKTLIENLLTKD